MAQKPTLGAPPHLQGSLPCAPLGSPPICLLHPRLGCSFSPARFNNEEVCTCPQVSVPEQFASVTWNSFNRDVLKALYGFAPIAMHCNKSSAVRFQVCLPGLGWGVAAGNTLTPFRCLVASPAAAHPSVPQAPWRTPAWGDRALLHGIGQLLTQNRESRW